jgi:hypothetical protein
MTSQSRTTVASLAALVVALAACSDGSPIAPLVSAPSATEGIAGNESPAPAGMLNVTLGSETLALWPFTGSNFSGDAKDPINLIFLGNADPRDIRASLMSLSGSGRPGPLAGITCTWDDAVGDPQTNYAVGDGWVGSAIQLECGNYQGPRFHLRMFRQGAVTVANAHYEILIPGTNMHEVLSWEFAELFVTADIARTNFLGAAPAPSGTITPSPYYRAVQAPVVGFLTSQQIVSLGLLVNGDGTASIPNDGRATVLTLAGSSPLVKGFADKDFILQFAQVIPKPFCTTGTTGYVYASGPVTVHMRSGIDGKNYRSEWTGSGTLTLIPFNPLTGQFAGAPYQGVVSVRSATEMTDGNSAVDFLSDQRELPDVDATHGIRIERLRAREEGKDIATLDIDC